MKRVTMPLNDELAEAFQGLVRARGYGNPSEAFSDRMRRDFGDVRLCDCGEGPVPP